MDYLDFDLEIREGAGREYPVAVIRSPAGEARTTMRFPYDELRLESVLKDLQEALPRSGGKRRSILSSEQQAARDFGQALFDALFVGDVRSRYDVSRERALQVGKGLRLRLRIQSPALAVLPWEFLYDDREAEYVGLTVSTPLVRYVDLPKPSEVLSVVPPLRILGAVCSPQGLPMLDTENEKHRVEEALRKLSDLGLVEFTWLSSPTWRALQREMRGGPWHVFHFIGHGGFDAGADEGLIYLADEEGEVLPLLATQLGRLLADHSHLRLVVLNTCEGARGSERDVFSSTASMLVRRGLSAVVAMQYEISDRAAVELARSLYEALADNWPVDAAVTEARKAVSFAVTNSVEWGTLVLYMRSPDGVLFRMEATPSSAGPLHETSPEAAPQAQHQSVGPAVFSPLPMRTVDPKPDLLISDEPIHPQLIRIPAGEFLIGDDKTSIEVAEFSISKYPITNAQYAAFVQVKNYVRPWHWKGGHIPDGKEQHPVEHVSWYDAVAYCEWLSEATGKLALLPNEAQWEKAARGADGREYPWGDRLPTGDVCNFDSIIGGTTPVGQYPNGASPYGVLDMAGNVWEWTSTLFKTFSYRNNVRKGYEPGDQRVMRGGSYSSGTETVRCAFRISEYPAHRNGTHGFRVVVAFP